MGQRWRSMGKAGSDDDGVIVLSSSDDEEANEDLSLEIVERARQREAKRRRSEDEPAPSVPPTVIDLSSASSDEVEVAPDRSAASGGGGPPAPQEGEAKKKKRRKPKKKKNKVEESGAVQADAPVKEDEALGAADSIITEASEISDNVVLRKLLRGSRYFDPGDRISETCYNCGEEGHRAANCMMERRQKPCFVCGMFGHNAKQCTQGQDCFICKRRGHFAKDCPDKHKQIPQDSKICLRCGDIGHDMSSCKNNYASDDLKEIQCYICKKYGHLCCVDFTFAGSREVSCYNCAQLGHTGLGCARQRGETSTAASPTLCYNCGEEGHFARGCTKNTKSSRWKGESSTPTHRFSKKNIDSPGFKSVPHDFGRAHKKKSMQHEDRRNKTARTSRIKGGWIVDDPGDLAKTKPRANGWISPATLVRKSPKVHSSAGPSSSSQSPHKKHKSFIGTPSRHVSMGAYQHGYTASRFGNSQGRSWRT